MYMKQHIKKIIEILFGTKDNITFKISLSSLTTSIIFLILSVLYKDNSTILNLLIFLCYNHISSFFIPLFLFCLFKIKINIKSTIIIINSIIHLIEPIRISLKKGTTIFKINHANSNAT